LKWSEGEAESCLILYEVILQYEVILYEVILYEGEAHRLASFCSKQTFTQIQISSPNSVPVVAPTIWGAPSTGPPSLKGAHMPTESTLPSAGGTLRAKLNLLLLLL